MKVVTVLASTGALLFGLAGAALAGTMYAGPLFPSGTSHSCSCQIVNVTTSPKTVRIDLLEKHGLSVVFSEPTLQPGEGDSVSGSIGSLQYCKFSNVTVAAFRATMVCVVDGSYVAVPAR
jgi:hypothetical protein